MSVGVSVGSGVSVGVLVGTGVSVGVFVAAGVSVGVSVPISSPKSRTESTPRRPQAVVRGQRNRSMKSGLSAASSPQA